MKALTIIFLTLSSFGLLSNTEYGDVVEMKLNNDCTINEMISIKDQFNEVLKNKGWDYFRMGCLVEHELN